LIPSPSGFYIIRHKAKWELSPVTKRESSCGGSSI